MNNELVVKKIKFIIMLALGVILVIKPTSLLAILIFVLGIYLDVLGVNSMISSIILIKFRKGWVYDGVKAILFLIIGNILLFNSIAISETLSAIFFIIIGLAIAASGIWAIVRSKETSAGIIFIVIGLLIALFPLGVSNLITRIIGISLIMLSVYLLVKLNDITKAS